MPAFSSLIWPTAWAIYSLVLICASAVGIYGSRGDEKLDERSALGDDFLAEVCLAWEGATAPAVVAGIRVVHLRTGIVLDASGGALDPLAPWQFYLTLGVMVGGGAVATGYTGQALYLPHWFARRRALAISIAYSGVGVGSIVLLPALHPGGCVVCGVH